VRMCAETTFLKVPELHFICLQGYSNTHMYTVHSVQDKTRTPAHYHSERWPRVMSPQQISAGPPPIADGQQRAPGAPSQPVFHECY